MRTARMFTAALIVLASCTALAHADDMAKSSSMKSSGSDMTAALEAKERAMCDAFKAKDVTKMMAMIDPNGWMVDASGINPVSKLPEMMKQYDVKSYEISDYKAVMIDKDAYVGTFTFKGDASMGGQPMPPGPFYESTVWVKRGKDWKAVYHQESMAMPMSTSADSK